MSLYADIVEETAKQIVLEFFEPGKGIAKKINMAVFDATKRDNIRLRKDLERLEQEVDRLKQENNFATSEIKNHYHQLQNALARLATYEEENRAFQGANAKLNVEVSELKNQMKELTTNSTVKPMYTLASAAATDCVSEMTRLAQEAKLQFTHAQITCFENASWQNRYG